MTNLCDTCKYYFNLHIDYLTGWHNCCNEENCYLCNSTHCYDYAKGEVPKGEIRGEWDYDREKRKEAERMSYKYDVGLVLKEDNYNELKEKINTQGIDDFEVNKFNNGQTHKIDNSDYIIVFWKYVGWDEPTNEMVQLVEEYLDMLNKNNIPYRYVKVGEFVEDIKDEICLGGGNLEPNEIHILNSAIYPKTIIELGFGEVD